MGAAEMGEGGSLKLEDHIGELELLHGWLER